MQRRLAATPIRKLSLSLARSLFPPLIARLRDELGARGIVLRPRFYLSTEYGCLVRSATIGLLWTDGFPAFRRLAAARGLRTRTPRQVMHTLRHEAGHAFLYAHQLYRSPRFRQLFGVRGSFFGSYPDVWRPGARERGRLARGEVVRLYATRHPDEDFAVCFETWLSLGPRWRRVFRDQPTILAKLTYVEDVAAARGPRRVKLCRPPLDEPVGCIALTVEEWMNAVLRGTNYNLHPGSAVA